MNSKSKRVTKRKSTMNGRVYPGLYHWVASEWPRLPDTGKTETGYADTIDDAIDAAKKVRFARGISVYAMPPLRPDLVANLRRKSSDLRRREWVGRVERQ